MAHGIAHPRRHRRGKRKWVRRIGMAVGLLALMAGVALWTLTRPWFLGWQLAPMLADKLGGEVTIARVEYEGDGVFRATDITLRTPKVSGEGGTIAKIQEAEVTVDPGALQRGRIRLTSVVVDGLTVRLSEDAANPWSYNFRELGPEKMGDGEQRMSPMVVIKSAVIEVGRHEAGRYEKVGERRVKGSLTPGAGRDGWYEFELTETNAEGTELGEKGIKMSGRWNKRTNEEECFINGVTLDDRLYRMLPIEVRRDWDRLDLQGRAKRMELKWKPEEGPSVQFAIEDVGITLPLETKLLWVRYVDGEVEQTQGRPRMQAREGELRFENDRLELRGLQGLVRSTDSSEAITPVPYEVNLTLGPIGLMDWKEGSAEDFFGHIKESAPFHAKFDVKNFRVQPKEGETAKVELPAEVANVFSRLTLRDWAMSTTVEAWRNEGEKGEDAIKVKGTAIVRDARVSYRKFSYELEDAEAYIEFDKSKAIVHRVTGKGSNGAHVTVQGEISPPTKEGSVNMRVTARDVPLDERFRAALKDKNLEAFDGMFDSEALREMTAAGVIPERAGMVKPGEAWGQIDLDLAVTRERGENKPTEMTGRVTVDGGTVMYTKFPYPVLVKSGWLDWEKDKVTLGGPEGKGWKVESIAGGEGWFTGSVEFRKEGQARKIRPHLTFEVKGDQMNRSVLAAIPRSKEERETMGAGVTSRPGGELSKAGRIVAGLNLEGAIDYGGTIDVGADGRVFYDVELTTKNGKIRPDAELAREVGLRDEVWPEGYAVSEVEAEVRIGRDRVELKRIAGKGKGAEEVEARGVIEHGGPGTQTELYIGLKHNELSERVLSVLSEIELEKARELWKRYEPRGLFTAGISIAGGPAGRTTTVTATPETVGMRVGGKDVLVEGESGAIELGNNSAKANGLTVRLSSEGRPDGVVRLDGILETEGGEAKVDVRGTWTGGDFESPWIREALAAVGTEEEESRVEALQLAGEFDAAFEYATAREDGEGRARFTAQPKMISANVRDSRVTVEVEKGEVEVSRGKLSIRGLAGAHAAGRVEVDGDVRMSGGIGVELVIGYDGRILSDAVQSFLPEHVKEVLRAIEFDERMSTRVRDGRLVFSEAQGEGEEREWNVKFDGTLVTKDAGFVAGVPFSEVEGELEIHVEQEAGSGPAGSIRAKADRLRVVSHTLTDVQADLELVETGQLLLVKNVEAKASGGRVTASAEVGLGERKDYRAEVGVVAVSLEEFFDAPKDLVERELSSEPERAPNRPTGDVYGSLTIAGERGNGETRRGRGLVRVPNGELATVPLGFRLLQLLQMSLPMGGKLDSAAVDFFIDGDLVKFERIVMERTTGNSAAVTFTGEGVMDYSTMDLNLRFRSRSGLLLVKEILGEVTDQLWEIEVRGPLSSPNARLVPLPGMRGDRRGGRESGNLTAAQE